ncbi:DUF3826 domain-containing protein [Mariniflexile jejuense]|uniref:DUF3826 domain-containing protein n=1 Tax=Mariniflexile jejuense TaxID=1173582 RepID=A0ABW3JI86_9FLAO
MMLKKISLGLVLLVLTLCNLNAQQHLDPEYIKVTNERAAKIVEELKLTDTEKEQTLTNIIGEQYRNLSKLHDGRDAKIEALKKSDLPKEKLESKIEKLKSKTDKSISKLHKKYIIILNKHLTPEKVDAVKDGMTYGVVPKTYFAFQDMLPNLTEAQKKYIYDNLVEAREHAMDAGTSKEKHAWFGKYKGRINNYLSAQGYDLNKESEDWHKRIEEREKAKN